MLLVLYGIVATFQPANFGRVYAAYGGIFITMAIIWGCQIDKVVPDRFDIIGGDDCHYWNDCNYVLAEKLRTRRINLFS